MSKKYAINMVKHMEETILEDIKKEYVAIKNAIDSDIKTLESGKIPSGNNLSSRVDFLTNLLSQYKAYKFISEKAF